MKYLKEILQTLSTDEITGNTNKLISNIVFDTNKVSTDSLFVAIKGSVNDSHNYINDAISLGSSAILCEYIPTEVHPKITYIKVRDTRSALGLSLIHI